MSDKKYLVFKINDTGFSIPIEFVGKVIDTLQTRSFQFMKPPVEGMFVFENKLIPMIKLQEALGIVTSNVFYSDVEESVIVGKYQHYYFAFRVDLVEGIVTVASQTLLSRSENPEPFNDISTEYSSQLFFDGQTNIFVIDIDQYLVKILTD